MSIELSPQEEKLTLEEEICCTQFWKTGDDLIKG